MEKQKNLIGVLRLPFLILTPVCVFLSYAVALHNSSLINYYHLFLAGVGALAAHAAVNILNEYADFKSGLDFTTKRTPFSGGSGTLPAHPHFAPKVLLLAVCAIIVVLFVGVYFLLQQGWGIILFFIAGMAIILAYSKWIVKHPIICLIVPGLGFGPLMVLGTYYAITGTLNLNVFFVSLIPFFLVNNLLLLNQFPDIEPDKKIGRKNILIEKGPQTGCFIYAVFMLITYGIIVLGVIIHLLPPLTLIGLITLLFTVPSIIGAFRNFSNTNKLIPFMGLNVVVNILTPILVGIGIIF